jgi:hypothetical protein
LQLNYSFQFIIDIMLNRVFERNGRYYAPVSLFGDA